MSGNRSLDEFVADPSEKEASASERPARDGEASAEPTGDAPGAADGPASTYAWHPDRSPCAACGEPVAERWRAGDDWVCGECKEW